VQRSTIDNRVPPISVTPLRGQQQRGSIGLGAAVHSQATAVARGIRAGAYVDERLTIYQWASVWTAEDVEQRIGEMCADEPERWFLDTNVFVSHGRDDARWDDATWGGATWGGAVSHHE